MTYDGMGLTGSLTINGSTGNIEGNETKSDQYRISTKTGSDYTQWEKSIETFNLDINQGTMAVVGSGGGGQILPTSPGGDYIILLDATIRTKPTTGTTNYSFANPNETLVIKNNGIHVATLYIAPYSAGEGPTAWTIPGGANRFWLVGGTSVQTTSVQTNPFMHGPGAPIGPLLITTQLGTDPSAGNRTVQIFGSYLRMRKYP